MAIPSKIKLYIIIIFIFLLPLFSSKDTNSQKEIAQYLIVSINGEIRLEDENGKLIWSNSIGKPLIKTDINVNNIDFSQSNILPSMNGGLYLVNERKNIFELLDVNFEDLILNPPSIFNKFITGIFYRNVKEKYFAIDILNGNIIKFKKGNDYDDFIKGNNNYMINNNTKNNYIIMKRITYLFQVRKNYELVWDANISKLEILNKGNSKIFHPKSNSSEYFVIQRNMKNNTYIYKYTSEKKELILLKIHNSDNSPYTFNFKQMNEINYFKKQNNNFYQNFFMFIFGVIATSIFIVQISNNKKEKPINLIEKTNEKDKDDEIEKNENLKNKNENSISAKNLSQLSTKSLLKNSFDEFCIKSTKSFNFCSKISLNHKESAPESDYIHTKIHKAIFHDNDHKLESTHILNSLLENDESLALNKNYQMTKITTKRHTICETNSINNLYLGRKLSDNITSKRKFHPCKSDLEELNYLTKKYLEDTIKQSSDSLNKIGNLLNSQLKYDEIYKIINSSNSNDSDSENSESPIPPELMLKSNFSLCDTGRFLKDFENIQFIGKGGFGTVFKAKHTIDGGIYAIKVIKSNLGIDDELDNLKEVQEIKTMLKVEHKNIVRYITCWFETKEPLNYNSKRSRALSMDEKNIPQKKNFGQNNNKFKKKIKQDIKLPLSRIQSRFNNEYEYESDDEDTYKDLKKNDRNINNHSDLYNDEESNSFSKSFQLQFDYSNSNSDDGIIFDNSNSHSKNTHSKDNSNNYKCNEPFILCDNESEIKNLRDKKNKKEINPSRKISDYTIKALRKKTYRVYFYMQMEYCEGIPLSYYIQQRKNPSNENLIIHIFYQICNAVQHIHSKSIIHRDLKPGNIFMNKKFKIKIIDFGLASENHTKNEESVGTALYLSPEQLEKKPYNEKVDIYALGIILMEMCCFFKTIHERRKIIKNVNEGKYPEEQMKFYENELKLIKKMTKYNPNERPGIEDVINSEEMKSMMKMI